MKKHSLSLSFAALTAFVLWTAAVKSIDVQPIGPQNSSVGFATLNAFVHSLTSIHFSLYNITDWLGLVPLCFMLGFAVLGLAQWIKRKSLLKVDRSLLVLGAFYLAVILAYAFFESFIINYRPVLIGGVLAASYPSSTPLLVLTVMPAAAMQLKKRIQKLSFKKIMIFTIDSFIIFMVIGRLLSGVHWFSDIIGSALLSVGLVGLYAAAAK